MKACEELTVKLSQGTSEVALGCMVCCCSRANADHCGAKALAFRRLPGPAVGVRIGTWPILTPRTCSVITAFLSPGETQIAFHVNQGLCQG